MRYQVKEIFYTLQGEGANASRPAVFCHFAGCNLWSGREQDRATAVCNFCDTDSVGIDRTLGGKFADADALVDTIEAQWPRLNKANRFLVMTCREPLLQIDSAAVDALQASSLKPALSTTRPSGGTSKSWMAASPVLPRSLGGRRNVGCKLAATVYFSPISCQISRYSSAKLSKTWPSLGPIFARAPSAVQAPSAQALVRALAPTFAGAAASVCTVPATRQPSGI